MPKYQIRLFREIERIEIEIAAGEDVQIMAEAAIDGPITENTYFAEAENLETGAIEYLYW